MDSLPERALAAAESQRRVRRWLCHRHGLEIDYAYVTSLVEIGQALGRFLAAHPDRECWHAHEEGSEEPNELAAGAPAAGEES